MTAAPTRPTTPLRHRGAHEESPFATVLDGIDAMAAADPAAPAVTDGVELLDRAQVQQWSQRAADAVVRAAGDRARVAVVTGRTVRQPIGFLAALRSGGSAVPLDPAAAVRTDELVQRAGIRVLVTDAASLADPVLRDAVDRLGLAVVDLDAVRHPADDGRPPGTPARRGPVGEEAYLLFTSGSTGRPKGVRIGHAGLAAFAWSCGHLLGVGPASRVVTVTRPTFDPTVMDLVCTLVHGGTLVVAGEDARTDPELLQRWCARQRVTAGFFPVALLPLLDPAAMPGLQVLHTGAEAPGPEQVERWTAGGARFLNSYGPTECTVAVCTFEGSGRWTTPLPIGRPHADHELLVVDPGTLAEVPDGEAGELLVAGPGLALGYLDDPERTAAAFVEVAGRRRYRTGDTCRWNPDGTLQFLGRSDRQVKIAGHRVEPAEVEAVLTALPGVDAAVCDVDPGPDGRGRLVAHVVGGADLALVRAALADRLPAASVPGRLLREDSLPRTASDKIDRAALRARRAALVGGEGAGAGDERGGAADAVARQLWRRWAGESAAGTGFAAAGGSSVQAMSLVAELRSRTGAVVRAAEVLGVADADALAALVLARAADAPDAAPDAALTDDPGAEPPGLSSAQLRLWLTEEFSADSHTANIALAYRISGAQAPGELVTLLQRALHRAVRRHPVLRWRVPTVDGRPAPRLLPLPAPEHLLEVETVAATQLPARLAELGATRFPLGPGPLWRATLLLPSDTAASAPPADPVLLVCLHHLVFDGWSVAPFVRDLDAGAAHAPDAPVAEPAAAVGTVDTAFAAHVRREQHRRALDGERHLAWWRHALADLPARPGGTAAPVAAPAGTPTEVCEHRAAAQLDAGELDATARGWGVRPAAVALAAVAERWGRRTGTDDVVVGLAVAGRDHPDTVDAVGMFVEVLPVRVRTTAADGAELARRADLAITQALAHDAVALQDIVADSRRHPGAAAVTVEVMLNVYNFPLPVPQLPGAHLTPVPVPAAGAAFPLTVYLEPTGATPTGPGSLGVRTVGRPSAVPDAAAFTEDLAATLARRATGDDGPPAPAASAAVVGPAAPAGGHRTGHGTRTVARVPAAGPTERALSEIWCAVLGLAVTDAPGVTANFFDVGGSSLGVTEVRALIAERLGRDLPVVDLFTWPTIRELADVLDRGSAVAGPIATPTPTATGAADRGAARRAAARRTARPTPQRRDRS